MLILSCKEGIQENKIKNRKIGSQNTHVWCASNRKLLSTELASFNIIILCYVTLRNMKKRIQNSRSLRRLKAKCVIFILQNVPQLLYVFLFLVTMQSSLKLQIFFKHSFEFYLLFAVFIPLPYLSYTSVCSCDVSYFAFMFFVCNLYVLIITKQLNTIVGRVL